MSEHTKEDCPYSEDIEKIKMQVNQKEWYSNKELHEDQQSLHSMFERLERKLAETIKIIGKYNGLREDLGNVIQRVDKMETKKKAKKESNTNWREWIGWILATVLVIERILQLF
ncbi:MAG: hypothetical protein ACQEQF_11045 [Bacillota bacterium]